MERDDRRSADDLDRFWDAVVAGHALPSPHDRDADLAALIALMHEAAATPPLFPDSARAWSEVLDRTPWATASDSRQVNAPATGASVAGAPNGRAGGPVAPLPMLIPFTLFRSAALGHIATAALLLLALTAVFVAVRQARPSDDTPIALPALLTTPDTASSTPDANAAVAETLFQATFPAAELPEGEVGAVFYRLTLDPGATLTQLGGLSCGCSHFDLAPGVGVELVESGEYTVHLDGPVRVQRRGTLTGSDVMPPGTDITLSQGDTAIYPVYDAPGTIRATGSDPVVIVGVVMVGMDEAVAPSPLPTGARGEKLSESVPSDWQALSEGPVTVTLRQVTLSAKATFGPYKSSGLEALQLEQGAIRRGIVPPGETEPRVRPPIHYAASSETFALNDVSPGFRRIITNAGDEPALLLVLTIEPAGGGPTLSGP